MCIDQLSEPLAKRHTCKNYGRQCGAIIAEGYYRGCNERHQLVEILE